MNNTSGKQNVRIRGFIGLRLWLTALIAAGIAPLLGMAWTEPLNAPPLLTQLTPTAAGGGDGILGSGMRGD